MLSSISFLFNSSQIVFTKLIIRYQTWPEIFLPVMRRWKIGQINSFWSTFDGISRFSRMQSKIETSSALFFSHSISVIINGMILTRRILLVQFGIIFASPFQYIFCLVSSSLQKSFQLYIPRTFMSLIQRLHRSSDG